MTLLEAAAKFTAVSIEMKALGPAIVARACDMIAKEAKRAIGTYDYGWPPLSPATLKHKRADTPLLETGEMRASIEWNSTGNLGYVGSNNQKAVWMEFGTAHIPPRSFLVTAAQRMEPKIYDMAARSAVSVISGHGLLNPETRELFHLLKHVAHELKEDIEDFVKEPDRDDSRGKYR
jgi:phage gpG-like protein